LKTKGVFLVIAILEHSKKKQKVSNFLNIIVLKNPEKHETSYWRPTRSKDFKRIVELILIYFIKPI